MSDLFDLAGSIAQFINTLIVPNNRPDLEAWRSEDVSTLSMAMTPVTPTAGPLPSMVERAHEQVAELQKADPDFNEIGFLASAAAQYGAALAAEAAMNPDALAGVATPDFIDCFRKRVADLQAAGLTLVIGALKILGSSIMKVAIDGDQQAITVRFTGNAVRCTKDASTGMATDGSLTADYYSEFATFVRPAGTTTPKSPVAGGATHCPSCGAPTAPGAATCPFCGTPLSGTGSSWLLDKLSASAYT